MKQRIQRGNILFLILLAVALFAALSYAVTQSIRGGGKSASVENASALASQLIQYGALIESTLNRSRIMNDIPEYSWDFSSAYTSLGANATCTKTACRIFNTPSHEGLMNAQPLSEKASLDETLTSRYMRFFIMQVLDVGTSAEDVVFLQYYVKPEVCAEINKQLNLSVDLTAGELFSGTITGYGGTMTSIPVTGSVIGDQATGIRGHSAGCFYHGTTLGYMYYNVLLVR